MILSLFSPPIRLPDYAEFLRQFWIGGPPKASRSISLNTGNGFILDEVFLKEIRQHVVHFRRDRDRVPAADDFRSQIGACAERNQFPLSSFPDIGEVACTTRQTHGAAEVTN